MSRWKRLHLDGRRAWAQHAAQIPDRPNPSGLLRDADCFAFGLFRCLGRSRPSLLQRCPVSTSGACANLSESFPCLTCGACCATYRVSFYWAEALGPLEVWTERLTPHMACMVGTNRPQPRCAALQGVVGESAFCTLYPERPSPCRELEPGDDRCARAREGHGLAPIRPLLPLDPPGLAAAVALDPLAISVVLPPEPPAAAVELLVAVDGSGLGASRASDDEPTLPLA
jgi:uncharacterized protein